VNGVSFKVNEGEILGIIGPNGCGKSTLFNCILGQLEPTEGAVKLDGRDVTNMRPSELNRLGVSRTFQLLQVFPELSVRENLILAGQEHEGTMLSRFFGARDAGLSAKAEQMIGFFKLGHLTEAKAGGLSYGQQKLLDAAMAFMAGPRLVLLDEPAGGVNLTMLGDLKERLRAINAEQGATFVVIEHNMDFVMSLCSLARHRAGRRQGPGRWHTGRSPRQSGGHRSLSRALRSDAMTTPILELDGVVGGYGAMTILNGTTFKVPRAAITTVIGPNGAGKSTVFKAIFGLLKVREGHIRLEGQEITNWNQRKLLEAGICYVPQGRNIFPELSVRHNIELGAVAAGSQITDMPRRIEAALDRFPSLRAKADVQASTLSGGQQKQLEIVRGLLLDPKLVLIDEPSIGLSPMLVQETFDILKELRAKGVTILMIEQNARSALEISDEGLVLELGQTRMQGPAATILADPRVAQLFLGGAMTEAA
jgi:branched-chain amino acid transport system ATP-binding protein